MTEPIRKITLAGGKTRYRCVVDVGIDPATGKRKQVTKTFDTQKEAKAWLAITRVDVGKGTFVGRDRTTVGEYLSAWVAGRTDVKPATHYNYENALKIPTTVLGGRLLQKVTKADVDQMVAGMLDGSLRSIGTKGKPLSTRAVELTLTILSQAFQAAVDEGRLTRNIVTLVKHPKNSGSKRTVWEIADLKRFLVISDSDRLDGAWRLSLHGLRRGEVLGLAWEDVDLDQGVVKVHQSRVIVGREVILQDTTKSTDGQRDVPISNEALPVVRRMKARQAEERLAAGPAWTDSRLVVVDSLGRPVTPRWYADRFKALARKAGVPPARLHDARHAFGSHLLAAGVSIPLVSRILGHSSPAITMAIYAHDLKDGAHDELRRGMVAAGM